MLRATSKRHVAVLDIKQHKLVALNSDSMKGVETRGIDLPRLKRNVNISLSEGKDNGALATVDLWKLGLGYNMNRLLGSNQKLHVLTR